VLPWCRSCMGQEAAVLTAKRIWATTMSCDGF
jgi:hypothetical protein